MSEFSFVEKEFTYNVKNTNDTTLIECIHNTQYYKWQSIFDKNIISRNDVNYIFSHNISPNLLYKLLLEYKNGTLDKTYKFIFQETYKNKDTEIMIELEEKLPYETNPDHKLIILLPEKIDESQRFDNKINNIKNILEQKYLETINILNATIAKLEANFVTKPEIANFVTKQEIADQNIK